MALRKTLRRVGNSVGIYIPPNLIELLGWSIGDKMEVALDGRGGLQIYRTSPDVAHAVVSEPEPAAGTRPLGQSNMPLQYLDRSRAAVDTTTAPANTPLDYVDPRQKPDW